MRCTYREAVTRARGQESRWPSRGNGNRLEPEAQPVLRPRFQLQGGQAIFSIGSCFARNMEAHLETLGFSVPTRSFSVPRTEYAHEPGNGILNKFTPVAIHDDIAWAARIFDNGGAVDLSDIEPLLFDLGNGRFVDMNLAGFMPVARERAIERRRELAELFLKAFAADTVILTLGLIEAWYDTARGAYIQQMPTPTMEKVAPGRFEFSMLSFEESLDFMRKSIRLLRERGHKEKKIVVTTSPVPIQRTFSGDDILVANSYAKSLLRTVAGYLYKEFEEVDYFPSYEIVTLSKSPEVWRDDLVHVTAEFIAKIATRVATTYVDTAAVADYGEKVDELDRKLVSRAEKAKLAIPLRQARPISEDVRFKENLGSIGLAPNQPGDKVAAVEFGPLDLRSAKAFSAALISMNGEGPEIEVRIEVRNTVDGAVGFSAKTTVGPGTDAKWNLRVPSLPIQSTVVLAAQVVGSSGDRRKARVRIMRPRFISVDGPSQDAFAGKTAPLPL